MIAENEITSIELKNKKILIKQTIKCIGIEIFKDLCVGKFAVIFLIYCSKQILTKKINPISHSQSFFLILLSIIYVINLMPGCYITSLFTGILNNNYDILFINSINFFQKNIYTISLDQLLIMNNREEVANDLIQLTDSYVYFVKVLGNSIISMANFIMFVFLLYIVFEFDILVFVFIFSGFILSLVISVILFYLLETRINLEDNGLTKILQGFERFMSQFHMFLFYNADNFAKNQIIKTITNIINKNKSKELKNMKPRFNIFFIKIISFIPFMIFLVILWKTLKQKHFKDKHFIFVLAKMIPFSEYLGLFQKLLIKSKSSQEKSIIEQLVIKTIKKIFTYNNPIELTDEAILSDQTKLVFYIILIFFYFMCPSLLVLEYLKGIFVNIQMVTLFHSIKNIKYLLFKLNNRKQIITTGIKNFKPNGSITISNLVFKTQNMILKIPYAEIPKNKNIGIIGPSASGKSTLLMILSKTYTDMEKKLEGSILIHSDSFIENCKQKSISIVDLHISFRDCIIMTFQQEFIDGNLSFYSNISLKNEQDLLPIDYSLMEFAIKKANIFDRLAKLNLHSNIGKFKLSGGEIRRICNARLFYQILIKIQKHKTLFLGLDEILSNLDEKTAKILMKNLMDFINELRNSGINITVFVIEHYVSLVMSYFDYVLIYPEHNGDSVQFVSQEQAKNILEEKKNNI